MLKIMTTLLFFPALPLMAQGLEGVWQGKIGDAEVLLCLQDGPYGALGAYYAVADGQIVTLEPDGSLDGVWHEASIYPTAALSFKQPDADHLTGTRDGDTSKQIALTRVPLLKVDIDDPDFTSCGSLTFSAARLEKTDATQQTLTDWHGRPYTHLTFSPTKLDVRLESFQLLGNSAAVRSINGDLALGFPGLDPMAEVLDCARSNLAWSGRDGRDRERRWPEILTDKLLVIGTQYDVYCGGAYPETSTQWQVLDLQTAEPVDTSLWLAEGALEDLRDDAAHVRESAEPPMQAFSTLFLKRYAAVTADGENCADLLSEDFDWFIRPSSTGMTFTQVLPHVAQACAVDVIIPYGEIWPFLSPSGQAMISAVRKALNDKD